ncbi:MAG: hypothetical protein EZS28_017165 [Streblomastix strix]|uniref:Uncharacterized protein n=1 Tax=Streblomastix strix TaxID=222440 RepID=A0A5J4VXF4_9EUKA|nr:MAG: hypothetical protein EZS28_017165 [Streblomastix strix]
MNILTMKEKEKVLNLETEQQLMTYQYLMEMQLENETAVLLSGLDRAGILDQSTRNGFLLFDNYGEVTEMLLLLLGDDCYSKEGDDYCYEEGYTVLNDELVVVEVDIIKIERMNVMNLSLPMTEQTSKLILRFAHLFLLERQWFVVFVLNNESLNGSTAMAVYEEETSNFKGQNERIERFLELDSYSYSYYYDEDEDLFYLSFGIICKLNLIVGFLLQICADAKDDPLRFAYEKVYSGAFVPNGRTRELNYCVSTSPGNKSLRGCSLLI